MHKGRSLPQSYCIRAATKSDVHAIQALLDALYMEEGVAHVRDVSALSRALFAPDVPLQLKALVAEHDGVVAGVLLYYVGYDSSSASFGLHLADIIVGEKFRRRGIARHLFLHMAAECLGKDAVWISLTVLRKNAAAIAFYKAMGFGKTKVDFYNMGISKITMHASELMQHAVSISN